MHPHNALVRCFIIIYRQLVSDQMFRQRQRDVQPPNYSSYLQLIGCYGD